MVPRLNAIQHAARYHEEDRSFQAKYPGEIGAAIKGLTTEIVMRLEQANKPAAQAPAPEDRQEAAAAAGPAASGGGVGANAPSPASA